ncbi:MAG: radical SAM protein [Promethearchaeota archaeon]
MNNELRPIAMVNITNRCTLNCKHCFVYRKNTPHTPTKKNEMSANKMIKELKKYRQKYGIVQMVWMGGEPLLRKDVLELGIKLFPQNTITTNGTLPLINLGPTIRWVISLDGPEEINDKIRGKGCFKRVINNLNNLPGDFQGDLQCNSVITKKNETYLEEFINVLKKDTPLRGVNFTFYVPRKIDTTGLSWESLQQRDLVIKDLMNLKKKYPKFILNNSMVLNLMLSGNAQNIVNDCPVKNYMLPLYLGKEGFERSFCCYGNDVNCDLCGAWAVFHLAALIKINPGWPINATSPFKKITSSRISQ